MWLFLAVPWVCLQFVIKVFPDHTHYFLHPSQQLWSCRDGQVTLPHFFLGKLDRDGQFTLPHFFLLGKLD